MSLLKIKSDKNRRVILNPKPFVDRIPFENKPFSNIPSAHNPIYNIRGEWKCSHCKSKKIYDSLWKNWMHFLTHHKTEPRNKSIILALADQLILEMKN